MQLLCLTFFWNPTTKFKELTSCSTKLNHLSKINSTKEQSISTEAFDFFTTIFVTWRMDFCLSQAEPRINSNPFIHSSMITQGTNFTNNFFVKIDILDVIQFVPGFFTITGTKMSIVQAYYIYFSLSYVKKGFSLISVIHRFSSFAFLFFSSYVMFVVGPKYRSTILIE